MKEVMAERLPGLMQTKVSFRSETHRPHRFTRALLENPDWDEVVLYHGTAEPNARRIMKEGFDFEGRSKPHQGRRYFSFATDPLISTWYAKKFWESRGGGKWDMYKAIVVCRGLIPRGDQHVGDLVVTGCSGGSFHYSVPWMVYPIGIVYCKMQGSLPLKVNQSKVELEAHMPRLVEAVERYLLVTRSGGDRPIFYHDMMYYTRRSRHRQVI